MFPSDINCVMINSGNIINSRELKTKAMQTPTEEVYLLDIFWVLVLLGVYAYLKQK